MWNETYVTRVRLVGSRNILTYIFTGSSYLEKRLEFIKELNNSEVILVEERVFLDAAIVSGEHL